MSLTVETKPKEYKNSADIKLSIKLYHKLDNIQKKLETVTDEEVKKGLLKNFNKNYKLYVSVSNRLKGTVEEGVK